MSDTSETAICRNCAGDASDGMTYDGDDYCTEFCAEVCAGYWSREGL